MSVIHQTVRPPAVAGQFYSADADALARDVQDFLRDAPRDTPATPPKALIAPHAGYVYSGSTAAAAYAQLAGLRDVIRRVVLLGPVHRVPVRGLALPGVAAFATPLGTVALDAAAVHALSGLPQVTVSAAAHAQEHSLEVHLPFLQTVLADFTLVPLAVGDASAEEVAQVLELLWGDAHTLIVVSSDLSHYLPYASAQKMDAQTVQSIGRLQEVGDHAQACGATPVNGLLLAARRHHLTAHLLKICNSGDTAGDKQHVVGYAALSFTEAPNKNQSDTRADADLGTALLTLARASIAKRLGCDAGTPAGAQALSWSPALQQAGASFVTLTQGGVLRGCIGSLEAHRALGEDVQANAIAAALHDPRFEPLSCAELARTRVEVSVLSAQEPIHFGSEAEALAHLRPGVDGVVLICDAHRSTFLPQVWEQLPQAREFMAHLKAKAGLPADFWSPRLRLYRYTVQKWKEPDTPLEATP